MSNAMGNFPGKNERTDEELVQLVEEVLFRRAMGYEDAAGKLVPPDVRAAMYWLENRCPERWKKHRSPEKEENNEDILTDDEQQL